MYVITRDDLPSIQRTVQATHAAIEAARNGLIEPTATHPHLVLCTSPDEISLSQQADALTSAGIRVTLFHEPDRNNELTAIATEPLCNRRRKLLRRLPLLQP